MLDRCYIVALDDTTNTSDVVSGIFKINVKKEYINCRLQPIQSNNLERGIKYILVVRELKMKIIQEYNQ